MDTDKERQKILEMIDSGQISVQEGIQLLNALAEEDADDSPTEQIDSPGSMQNIPMPEGEPRLDEPQAEGAASVLTEPSPADEPAVSQAPPSVGETPDPSHANSTYRQERAVPFESEPEVLPAEERFDPSKLRYRNFWLIPLWVGAGITILGSLLMYWAWNANGFGFWFACTWVPFFLGVAVMALAWASRTARWLHVRVHQKPGEKPGQIAISLPIPLRLTAFLLRMFGDRIPHMEGTSLDEVILALDATTPEAPFYVEVNEGEDGERVEVYIG